MAQTQKSLHQLAANTAEKLPEVSLSEPFGDGCLVHKVVDKVFMLSLYLNGHAIINLKVQPEHGAMLRDFYPYIRTGWHMNKQHWISIFADEDLDDMGLKHITHQPSLYSGWLGNSIEELHNNEK